MNTSGLQKRIFELSELVIGQDWRNVHAHAWMERRARIDERSLNILHGFDGLPDRLIEDVQQWADEGRLVGFLDGSGMMEWFQRGERLRMRLVEEMKYIDYIDLDTASALVSRAKKTLERQVKKDPTMPAPLVQGGGGKRSEWDYSVLRPWLESKYGRRLPPRPPRAAVRT